MIEMKLKDDLKKKTSVNKNAGERGAALAITVTSMVEPSGLTTSIKILPVMPEPGGM